LLYENKLKKVSFFFNKIHPEKGEKLEFATFIEETRVRRSEIRINENMSLLLTKRGIYT
jgi:hypothetical protein